jgi:hypothetical protein
MVSRGISRMGLMVVAGLLAAGPDAQAAPPKDGAVGKGTLEKGSIDLQLYRGAVVPFEITVIATPNECNSHLDLNISWDESKNEVRLRMRGKNALEQYPSIDRTLGENYLPNPHFPEPEDFDDGRYQLWIVGAAGPVMPFYYDIETLDLLGGAPDFETPPVPAIPVPFPTLYMFSTPTFQPKKNGDVKVDWTFPYDSPHRGDRPEYSYHVVTFPPPNLCGANPFRLDLSTLRPWISDPLPREDARPWSDYLRGGLLFDVTVEPSEYYVEPPITTLVATYSGGTAVGGGVPRDWQLDIDAAFAGLAPPIRRWEGAGKCEDTFQGFHFGPNFCE